MIPSLVLALTVSTHDAAARSDFTRGMALLYAYDRAGASAAFADALRQDPKLAIAAWGEALAVGSDLNHPLSEDSFAAAQSAMKHAVALAQNATSAERSHIDALALRYAGSFSDYGSNETRYVAAMDRIASQNNDDDAAVLEAEALLEDRAPNDDSSVQRARSLVQDVLARNPRSKMANHLCIHIFDSLPDHAPGRACADRLNAMQLLPQEEHLAHMAAHNYVSVGDYSAAVRASERAWQLRTAWKAASPPYDLEYAIHDASVGYSAAMMLTDYDTAAVWDARLGDEVQRSLRALTLARFGRWNEILALGDAAKSSPFALGLAYVHQNDYPGAQRELAELQHSNNNGDFADMLDAAIREARGDFDGAATALQRAVSLQSQEYGAEYIPLFPAAEALGELYLRANKLQQARDALHQALSLFPNDPRALDALKRANSLSG